MISALDKLERAQMGWWRWFFRPLRSLEPGILRTHPITAERIGRLLKLADGPADKELPKWHFRDWGRSAHFPSVGINFFSDKKLRRTA